MFVAHALSVVFDSDSFILDRDMYILSVGVVGICDELSEYIIYIGVQAWPKELKDSWINVEFV